MKKQTELTKSLPSLASSSKQQHRLNPLYIQCSGHSNNSKHISIHSRTHRQLSLLNSTFIRRNKKSLTATHNLRRLLSSTMRPQLMSQLHYTTVMCTSCQTLTTHLTMTRRASHGVTLWDHRGKNFLTETAAKKTITITHKAALPCSELLT